ncbi:MAG: hypothetical protein ACOX71_04775 [Lachnospiraceae bacterium]
MDRKVLRYVIHVIAGIYVMYLVGKSLVAYFKGDFETSWIFVALGIVCFVVGGIIAAHGVYKAYKIYTTPDPEETENPEESSEEKAAPKSVTVFGKTVSMPEETSISDRLKALSVDEDEEAGINNEEGAEGADSGEGSTDSSETEGSDEMCDAPDDGEAAYAKSEEGSSSDLEDEEELSESARSLEERLTRGI